MEDVGLIMPTAMLDPEFWKNKRVLLTGHSGFKGAWLGLWLERLGAIVTGVSLPPDTRPNLFELSKLEQKLHSHFCDIRDYDNFRKIVQKSDPEIIFHLAAQPLVLASYESPLDTFSTNVMGTTNLLEISRALPNVKAIVVVTTDKVYKNTENGLLFKEDDPLGGLDPYSSSKAAVEMVVSSYRHSFFQSRNIKVSTARAGNVIGGGDWSKNRILPDAISAWKNGDVLLVRNPNAVRPWQHVLEPIFGYLMLAQKSFDNKFAGEAFNFGPNPDGAVPVYDLIFIAQAAMGYGEVEFSKSRPVLHEANNLMLDNGKSSKILGISPVMNLKISIDKTISWHKEYWLGRDVYDLCNSEISEYMELL